MLRRSIPKAVFMVPTKLTMADILARPLAPDQAALWALGQAGALVRAGGLTVVIDPYLSDSVGAVSPDFARQIPVPLAPEELQADVYLVTHDHMDHLDPDTLRQYKFIETTTFVAPRLTAAKLATYGIPEDHILRVEAGDTREVCQGLTVTGIFALPTSTDALDTAGYRLEFANGRSLYHT